MSNLHHPCTDLPALSCSAIKHAPAVEERLQKSERVHHEIQATLILASRNLRAVCLAAPKWSWGCHHQLLDVMSRPGKQEGTYLCSWAGSRCVSAGPCLAGRERHSSACSCSLNLWGRAQGQHMPNSLTKHLLPS